MDCPELELFKDIPGFTAIVKAVLKSQMTHLIGQLSRYGGEETMVVSATVGDGTLGHLSTTHARGFLDDRDEVKAQFLKHCINNHHGSLARDSMAALDNLGQLTSNFRHTTTPPVKPSYLVRQKQFQDSTPVDRGVNVPTASSVRKRKLNAPVPELTSPTSAKQSCHTETGSSDIARRPSETVGPSDMEYNLPAFTMSGNTEAVHIVKKETVEGPVPSNRASVQQWGNLEDFTAHNKQQSHEVSLNDVNEEYGEIVVKTEVDSSEDEDAFQVDTDTEFPEAEPDLLLSWKDQSGVANEDDVKADSTPDKRPSDSSTRFKRVSEEELAVFESSPSAQARSTMRNTKWGLKLFQDWHIDIYGQFLNIVTVSKESLVEKLRKFYCEARPKEPHTRANKAPATSSEMYHKNTLKNIRAAINRHLNDIGRHIDIVHDREFKPANRALDGLMRTTQLQTTTHAEQITEEDLGRISAYFTDAPTSPIILRHCVMFNLAIHFSTSLTFLCLLKQDSFSFHMDKSENEYVLLNAATQAKVLEAGIVRSHIIVERRMYGSDSDEICPLKMLRLLQQKTHAGATSLFNRFSKEALCGVHVASKMDVWYGEKPLAKRTFLQFLPEICRNSNCIRTYTAHSLQLGGY